MGCSTQSVPSWSNVAMRSAGGTKLGLPCVVVDLTKSTMAFFAAPSFQDGSGSVCAKATVVARLATTAPSTKRRVGFMVFPLFLQLYLQPLRGDLQRRALGLARQNHLNLLGVDESGRTLAFL